jgi:hypothetical protein
MSKPFDWNDYPEGQLLAGMIAAMKHPDFRHLRQYRGEWHCVHRTSDGGTRSVWTNSFIPDLPRCDAA